MKRRVLALAAVTLTIVSLFPIMKPASVAWAYSCSGGVESGNCYGVIDWQGAVNGGLTAFTIRPLAAGNGHANLEQWIIGNPPSGQVCPISGDTGLYCFVEAGQKTGPGQCPGYQCYFWNDLRPCQGCSDNYNEHFIAYVTTGDEGNTLTDDIHRTSGNSFAVSLSAPSGSYNNSSTNNPFSPIDIEIGAEVQGSSGASIPQSNFTGNKYVGTNNVYTYQTNPGSSNVISPVQARWLVQPSVSNPGGNWQVSCPC